MERWGTRAAADCHALEGAAVALTAWLAGSAIRADLDFVWHTMSLLFTL